MYNILPLITKAQLLLLDIREHLAEHAVQHMDQEAQPTDLPWEDVSSRDESLDKNLFKELCLEDPNRFRSSSLVKPVISSPSSLDIFEGRAIEDKPPQTMTRKLRSQTMMSTSDILNRNVFQCYHCGFDSGSKRLLKAHMSRHTSKLSNFSCKTCGYRAPKYADLLTHIKIHVDVRPFECYHCDYKAKKIEHLRRHIEAHLGIKRFACTKCEYRTNSSYSLKVHVEGHSTKPRFACKKCDFRCTKSVNLKNHQRVHSRVKSYSCGYCSYRTRWSKDLKEHESIHTGFKPYQCSFCSYRCITSGGLKSHTRTHTGEKPFQCKYCDFRTAHRSALRKHVAGHKGVFPFTCPYCSYKTQYQTNIKHHIMVHENDRPECCPHCDFRCVYISELNCHMRTHTGEKPYACNLCDFRAAFLRTLKNHLKICDPARLMEMKKAKNKGVERLYSDDEETIDSDGSDLEGMSSDSIDLDESISCSASDEDFGIVRSVSKTVNKNKNSRSATKATEISEPKNTSELIAPNKTDNTKTCGDGSQAKTEQIKCKYSFFVDEHIIGEYSV